MKQNREHTWHWNKKYWNQVNLYGTLEDDFIQSLIRHSYSEVVRDDAVTFKNFGWEGEASARYIRYQALASDKFGGVLFTDEIVVK